MKHQGAINSQRIKNMKNGITEAQGYIDQFMCMLSEKLKTNSIEESDIEDLGEVQSLLDWIKNQ